MPQWFEQNDLHYAPKIEVSSDVRKLLPSVIRLLVVKRAAQFYQARPEKKSFQVITLSKYVFDFTKSSIKSVNES